MDLIDQLQALAKKASQQFERLETEEATKNALVMPFINALGYNVFDPVEVTPEFTADVGVKRGEKVDYAVMRDGKPIILFECKTVGTDLDKTVMSQLFRYFTVTEARIAVCTNGIRYRFYSDLDKPNRMDDKPFLDFEITAVHTETVDELKKLSKHHFDESAILEAASDLKYKREIKKFLSRQLTDPDEAFVRVLASAVFSGRLTKTVRTQFDSIAHEAFREFIREEVQDRIQSALDRTESPAEVIQKDSGLPGEEVKEETIPSVVTTEQELEGFYIVKSILRRVVEAGRISGRDVQTYFGILLDNNNRKPLARLRFNTGQKYIGLFDNPEKQEDRVPIKSLDEIYTLGERLRNTLRFYEPKS